MYQKTKLSLSIVAALSMGFSVVAQANNVKDKQGDKHNYFCQSYQQIFQHLMPAMNFMVTLHSQNYPLELVSVYRDRIYNN